MSMTDFENDPIAYASRYPFLVVEQHILDMQPDTAAGTHEMLDTDTYKLAFDIGSFGDQRTVTIYKTRPPGVRALYFLPYKPDAATSMKLDGGCDYFFTSALSGCTVQVYGNPASPVVTHANAGDHFKKTFAAEKDRRENLGEDDITSGESADRAASQSTDTVIDRMLPSPGQRTAKILRKSDYMALYDQRNFNRAKKGYMDRHKGDKWQGYKLYKLEPSRAAGRPEIGATVFGIRNFRGVQGWSIFYQATLGVQPVGRKHSGFLNLGWKKHQMSANEVVVGGTRQLFP